MHHSKKFNYVRSLLFQNQMTICEHIVEKFEDKDAKNTLFNKKMNFRKRSN